MTELIAHKFISQEWSTSRSCRYPKIDKHTFYAKDSDIHVLKYLVTRAKCPLGVIVMAEDMGIGHTIPTMSPQ